MRRACSRLSWPRHPVLEEVESLNLAAVRGAAMAPAAVNILHKGTSNTGLGCYCIVMCNSFHPAFHHPLCVGPLSGAACSLWCGGMQLNQLVTI